MACLVKGAFSPLLALQWVNPKNDDIQDWMGIRRAERVMQILLVLCAVWIMTDFQISICAPIKKHAEL